MKPGKVGAVELDHPCVEPRPRGQCFTWNIAAYRADVLPAGVPVLSVEAGVTFGWAQFADDSIGIDRFGASAPGNVVMDKLGINVAHVVARATALAGRNS